MEDHGRELRSPWAAEKLRREFEGDGFVARESSGLVGRPGRDVLSARQAWWAAVQAVDWTRALIEARAEHARKHQGNGFELCGPCLRDVLLKDDGALDR